MVICKFKISKIKAWGNATAHKGIVTCGKTAKIIDIGGGDSTLVDYLLQEGFNDISVLDISQKAISKATERLGSNSKLVNWIISDVVTFESNLQYDFWHDRATFHFLTNEEEISQYLETVNRYLKPGGILLIGTFSDEGPTKCSGIDIRQYTEASMSERFKAYFTKIECIKLDHQTPSGPRQNFIFCSFKKPRILSIKVARDIKGIPFI